MKKIASLLLVLLLLLGTVMLLASCDAGKSAYDIAVEHGFVGTEEEWLASLKGAAGEKGETGEAGAKGDTGEKGETGAKGESGDQGNVTPAPNGVKDVSFAYKWSKDGQQMLVCTITMDDGSTVQKECTLPEKVEKLVADVAYVPVGEKNPAIFVTPYYEGEFNNGFISQGSLLVSRTPVLVTADMVIDGSLDFSTVGTKKLTVFYNGAVADVTVKVFDPANITIDYVDTNGMGVILKTDGTNATYDMTGVSLEVVYTNGSSKYVQVTKEMLDLSDVLVVAPGWSARVPVTYGGVRAERPLDLYFVDPSSLESIPWESCVYYPPSWRGGISHNVDAVCAKGSTGDLGYLGFVYDPYEDNAAWFADNAIYYVPITADMLRCNAEPVTFTQTGAFECTVDYSLGGVFLMETITLGVYDASTIYDIDVESSVYRPTATNGELPEMMLCITHNLGIYDVYEYAPLTPDMLDVVPDCTVEGEKHARVTYQGRSADISFYISTMPDLWLSIHRQFDEIRATSAFPQLAATVWWNDNYYHIVITEDMLKEKVSFDKAGRVNFTVTYRGEACRLSVYVYDPAVTKVKDATLVRTPGNPGAGGLLDALSSRTVGASPAEFIETLVNGYKVSVQYFREYIGSLPSDLPGGVSIMNYRDITADMIDLSGVDFTKPGTYTYTVTCEGYVLVKELKILPDFSTATLLYTFYGAFSPFDSSMPVKLYDNGYYVAGVAVVTMGGNVGEYTFDAVTGLLILELEDYGGKGRYTVTFTEDDGGTVGSQLYDGTFTRDASLDAVAPVASYTFEIEGTAGSIVLANADYAIISIIDGGMSMPLMTCEYTVSEDGNTLSCFGMDFTINGDGTLTPLD